MKKSKMLGLIAMIAVALFYRFYCFIYSNLSWGTQVKLLLVFENRSNYSYMGWLSIRASKVREIIFDLSAALHDTCVLQSILYSRDLSDPKRKFWY